MISSPHDTGTDYETHLAAKEDISMTDSTNNNYSLSTKSLKTILKLVFITAYSITSAHNLLMLSKSNTLTIRSATNLIFWDESFDKRHSLQLSGFYDPESVDIHLRFHHLLAWMKILRVQVLRFSFDFGFVSLHDMMQTCALKQGA